MALGEKIKLGKIILIITAIGAIFSGLIVVAKVFAFELPFESPLKGAMLYTVLGLCALICGGHSLYHSIKKGSGI